MYLKKKMYCLSRISLIVAATLSFLAPAACFAGGGDLLNSMLASGQGDPSTFFVSQDITLPEKSRVRGSLIFEGGAASGVTLNCNGSSIEAGESRSGKHEAIVIRSRKLPGGDWEAPTRIAIENCVVLGSIRVYGIDKNANGAAMKESSLDPGHTARVQKAAPSRIEFRHVRIVTHDGVALYIGPGVTRTALIDSVIEGTGTAPAVYMDAESAGNLIARSEFSYRSAKREVVAIDGSAHNTIKNSIFKDVEHGGIFIYRNCGEGGVIRHQKPEFNAIEGNTFIYGKRSGGRTFPAVWIGSRQGRESYCFRDPDHPFGSSLSPLDFARHNTVSGNIVRNWPDHAIENSDDDNVVLENSFH
ncbi:hypothetical protein C7405_103446 [Paraburkholderia caballeronis]|uniref:right-handed parallel beta-helix repeat-containing protein n=1 Tax=Paraburkholderia caballeronis TaxID=416943 RepID=UPI00106631EB|nr:right-handed parallel beta-helix repeat-containing protein [Paraburkholderia caballeronis]TDV37316.1 hypothetical protein C7405_103446 [Paraburkholderia caballeronis]